MTIAPVEPVGGPLAVKSLVSSRVERFPLFSRFAGAVWFALLALVYLRISWDPLVEAMSGEGGLSVWAQLASHCCVAIFYAISCWLLLVRPPSLNRQEGVVPVVIAFAGTYLVWLIALLPPAPPSPALDVASAAIGLVGEALIIYTLCRLGRSFSIAPQARRLVTDGPYLLVRHPLYATEEIVVVAILMRHAWWAALGFFLLHVALQLRRMAYEEQLLRSVFPDYDAYARRTARLIPGVW
jgi:protein-S-isoprenylcysteine O-methyltransferase Ste14